MEALIAQYQKAIQLRALNLYSQHGMKQMKITAEKLAKKPAQAYREADKGNTVTINHDRYPDKVFELTARERRTRDFLGLNEEQERKILNTPLSSVMQEKE